MQKKIKRSLPAVGKKFFTLTNISVLSILLIAFFVRIFRIDQLLGFYYDQGRDAGVIWNLIYNHKFFLIGPTTGIEGIFRGPWYYWLITPFYWLGKGNPVYPSIFLSLTVVISLYLFYKIGEKIGGKVTGFLAIIIGSISYDLVMASRWLSNPTPMFLISVIFLYSLFMILDGKRWAWILTAFFLGLAMQFGSATEIFYFPALLILIIWQRKNLPNWKIIFISVLLFFITIAPQFIFDIKHDGVLRDNIYKFIFTRSSFKLSFWETVKVRIPFYYNLFASKLFSSNHTLSTVFVSILAILVAVQRKIIFKNKNFVMVLIFFLAPLIGMLFFQGNEGNVYDYYFTGYYLIFILLFSIVFGSTWKNLCGKILIFSFLFFFVKENAFKVKDYITSGVDGPSAIAFGNQKQAIDWIYKDANGRDFNVDEYVPPVIPYSYNYLFTWLGNTKYHKLPVEPQISLLYTLYEVDSPYPERLEAWLTRQKGIGKVIKEQTFGGITVQERQRIPGGK